MRTSRRWLLAMPFVGGMLLGGATLAAAGDPPPALPASEEAANQWMEAFRAGDVSRMRAVAGDTKVSAPAVADTLLIWYERGATAAPPAPEDFLAAAVAFAELARSRPEARTLPDVVAAWGGLSLDELTRNLRLRAAAPKAASAVRRQAWTEVLDLVEPLRPDLGVAHPISATLALCKSREKALEATGRAAEAASACREAVGLADVLRRPLDKAFFLRQLGVVEMGRNRHVEASAAFEEAVAISEVFGRPSDVAWARTALCRAWVNVGSPVDALSAGERALAEQEALGDTEGMARVLISLGDARRALDRPIEARDLYDRARLAFEKAGNGREAALASCRGASMSEARGEFSDAEERFTRTIALAQSLGLVRTVAEATLGLGVAVRELRSPRDAVAIHARAAELAASSENAEVEVTSHHARGIDHLRLAEFARAVDAFETSIRCAKRLGFATSRLTTTYKMLAKAYRLADRPRDAVQAALVGVSLGREHARALGDLFGVSAQVGVRSAADEGMLAAAQWAIADPASRNEAVASAFVLLESARGAHLADALLDDRRASTPEALAEGAEERQVRERFETARRRVLLLAFGDGADAVALADARRDYETASDARRESLARAHVLKRDSKELPVEPVTLEAVRAAVPEGGLLVLYHVTAERVFAVTIGREGADLLDLGDAPPIVRAAKDWLVTIATPDGVEGSLPETLYRALLAPVAPRLRDGAKLLIGRDGPLSFLPFEALVQPADGGSHRRAVEAWSIAYVPSATVYTALARRAESGEVRAAAIVLGDPIYPGEGTGGAPISALALARGLASLDRLPASADEARDVASRFAKGQVTLLLRGDSTRARLLSAIEAASGRLRVLHLACHGFADDRIAGRSGLVLSDADILTVDDVSRMRVPADLVVLSACESGKGRNRKGEGVLGLARAFLGAGATRVVAADRTIGDEFSREIIRRFYDGVLRDGLDPAAALRAAKVAKIRAAGAAAHPYAWAGLVLWE